MYETIINSYLFSADKSKLQIDVIYNYLSKESYWAQNIPMEIVKKSAEGSLCFGVYFNTAQIGYARMITDKATFSYLADVFILDPHKGKGLSKQLMKFIMEHPDLQGLRRMALATRDAHDLYKQFGFTALSAPDRMMEIKFFDSY
jgi:GNAT superfamily N-acetyltransferase